MQIYDIIAICFDLSFEINRVMQVVIELCQIPHFNEMSSIKFRHFKATTDSQHRENKQRIALILRQGFETIMNQKEMHLVYDENLRLEQLAKMNQRKVQRSRKDTVFAAAKTLVNFMQPSETSGVLPMQHNNVGVSNTPNNYDTESDSDLESGGVSNTPNNYDTESEDEDPEALRIVDDEDDDDNV